MPVCERRGEGVTWRIKTSAHSLSISLFTLLSLTLSADGTLRLLLFVCLSAAIVVVVGVAASANAFPRQLSFPASRRWLRHSRSATRARDCSSKRAALPLSLPVFSRTVGSKPCLRSNTDGFRGQTHTHAHEAKGDHARAAVGFVERPTRHRQAHVLRERKSGCLHILCSRRVVRFRVTLFTLSPPLLPASGDLLRFHVKRCKSERERVRKGAKKRGGKRS